jgi:hypothetical protein
VSLLPRDVCQTGYAAKAGAASLVGADKSAPRGSDPVNLYGVRPYSKSVARLSRIARFVTQDWPFWPTNL